MAALAGENRRRPVIPVASPIAEPPAFDANCRERGRQWLAAHPHQEGRPHDYWSPFRDDLREGFGRRCGYLAMYMHDGAADHFISWDRCKLANPQLAYEWNNYRFIAPSLNSKKGTWDDALLDPFEVQSGWFEVEIPSFVLRITDRVPEELRGKAKGPCKNNFGDYGAGILVAGEARATSIPRQWVCKERATKPAAKRPSQKHRSYFCTVPNPNIS
ncbi:MAG TPA: hypothetical protein VF988_13230 [Verrucomicrobiae bacterium]